MVNQLKYVQILPQADRVKIMQREDGPSVAFNFFFLTQLQSAMNFYMGPRSMNLAKKNRTSVMLQSLRLSFPNQLTM